MSLRPGEFGRKLDHLLRMAALIDATSNQSKSLKTLMRFAAAKNLHEQQKVTTAFLAVADAIPTRNLLQLAGHLNSRASLHKERIVFPKGSLQKAIIIPGFDEAIDATLLLNLQQGIRQSLIARFATQDTLGKVWLAPELMHCPLPSQQRSASAGLHNMARGTRLPMTADKDTLRLFVYWKGQDIDLSASFHADDGEMIERVSYTNLKSSKYRAHHSGDITSAPNGASEFIDIDRTYAL
uniref:Cytoplasmic protein n=1 Tax=uncultured Thiotrichaceae bacterium TaxID=298394 RepID=A0A6S6UMK4_9GAMM|nr:MAG: Cytoplasmic protein [uncultured Thiotrichaceae bacterium]